MGGLQGEDEGWEGETTPQFLERIRKAEEMRAEVEGQRWILDAEKTAAGRQSGRISDCLFVGAVLVLLAVLVVAIMHI